MPLSATPDRSSAVLGRRPRVVLADDSATARLATRAVLEATGQLEVAAEAADGWQALEAVEAHQPDLLLLDLDMPGLDGLEALPLLAQVAPGTAVVVLSGVAPARVLLEPRDGVAAYLTKDQGLDEVARQVVALAGAATARVPAARSPLDRQPLDLVARLSAVLRFQEDLQTQVLDGPDVLQRLAVAARTLVGADGAAVELVHGDDLVYEAADGSLAGAVGTRVSVSGSLSGAALRSGRILASRDTEVDERVDRAACRRVAIRSLVVVPLGSAGGVQGVLKVAWAEPSGFGRHDQDLLALVTRAAAARLDLAASSAALAASERLFRTALDGAPIGTALVALDGHWLQVNDALVRLVGYDQQQLRDRTVRDLTHPADVDGDLQLVDQLLRGDIPSYSVTQRFLHARGHVVWVRRHASLLRDAAGAPLHYIAQIEDITALHSQQAELERLAVTDPLTGLANRAGLLHAADRAMTLDRARPCGAAMLLLDLDHFKLVNDSLGHQAGDALLQAVAVRLVDATRPGDVVARLGGDEFVVLLDGAPDLAEVDLVAERLVAELARPFDLDVHGTAHCGCSLGAARAEAGTSAAELYRRADLALYRAKDAGRGRHAHYDASLHRDAEVRLSSEQVLRSSLDAGDVLVHYQPIVDLRTGAVVGLEALARLRRSALPPGTFIPVAEDTGLVARLDGAVLAAVLDMTDRPPAQLPDLDHVHVNVAPASLADPSWQRHADVDRMTHGVTVSLEVTERTLLAGGGPAADVLRSLSSAGVRTGLDDFGTGRASLAVLHEQAMDFLKVDRSFVARLAHDPRARAVVHGIVVIAQELGLTVVAEGVETEQQLTAVRAAGCHLAQGYLLGRPGPVADLRPPPAELFAGR